MLNPTLKRIKRLIIQGDYLFTLKAENELAADGLIIEDALEAILNAVKIDKVLNSTSPKTGRSEKLYIIKSYTYDGVLVYTKGKIEEQNGHPRFYILISSKRLL